MSDQRGPEELGPTAEAAMVQPAILPTQYMVDDTVLSDGRPVVMLQVLTPCGTNITFLDPPMARRVASMLVDAATRARAGGKLIVPQFDASKLNDLRNGEGPPA